MGKVPSGQTSDKKVDGLDNLIDRLLGFMQGTAFNAETFYDHRCIRRNNWLELSTHCPSADDAVA